MYDAIDSQSLFRSLAHKLPFFFLSFFFLFFGAKGKKKEKQQGDEKKKPWPSWSEVLVEIRKRGRGTEMGASMP